MPRVLVIEDDDETAREIVAELESRGFETVVTSAGDAGLARALSEPFDVITLDRMLPGLDGLGVVSTLREQRIETPVLMISALSDVDERIAGLRAGGDDYMTKPFASDEMAARVEALLRRRGAVAQSESVLKAGDVEIDLIKRRVRVAGREVKLLNMEFKLLEFMLRNAGQVLSRRMLFENVWGYYFDPGANLINVHVARLRKKLDPPGLPTVIATVKGAGYRFDARA